MDERINAGKIGLYKRIRVIYALMLIVCALLIGVLANIQLINYEKYQLSTVDQYTKEVEISAKRGTIYDCNMKPLAVSATVERVFIDPSKIPDMTVSEYIEDKLTYFEEDEVEAERARLNEVFKDKSITIAQDIANELSDYLGVDKETILKKTEMTKRADETIKNQVELEVTAKIREMIKAKYYSKYIFFAEQTKRYYPYGSLASHVLGFTGTDNVGIQGVEAYYESILQGIPGKTITAKNGRGDSMSFKYETYVSAQDGTDIMLTIDWTIQHTLEKYLEKALSETQARNKVCGIIMDVNTGGILAMATMPDFDLNEPFVLDGDSAAKLEEFEGTDEEKTKFKSDLLYSMWKNKAITEIYEPGSTFKVITSTMALEEGLTNPTEQFNCSGSITIPGYPQPIHCHKTTGHGTLTFREALMQSCNPTFVRISQRIGTDLFYKYYQAYGYTGKTGIDMAGEASNLFFTNFNTVDLAAASFGQNFKVTPISHLTAFAAAVNGGYLLTPHILKATVDENGNVAEGYDTSVKRQVVSEETSAYIRDFLEGAVESGGAKNAAVAGYRIGAKTGTSVKTEKSGTEKYHIASAIAVAPIDDPQIAVMIIVDEPVGSFYGGIVSAPIASNVLSEVLPYLGIEPSYEQGEIDSVVGTAVSNYANRTVDDAKADITKNGFEYKIVGNGEKVVGQSPQYGATLSPGGIVVLYTEEGDAQKVAVPNVIGKTASEANRMLTNAGLNVSIANSTVSSERGAVVYRQSKADEEVPLGTVISLDFRVYDNVSD